MSRLLLAVKAFKYVLLGYPVMVGYDLSWRLEGGVCFGRDSKPIMFVPKRKKVEDTTVQMGLTPNNNIVFKATT